MEYPQVHACSVYSIWEEAKEAGEKREEDDSGLGFYRSAVIGELGDGKTGMFRMPIGRIILAGGLLDGIECLDEMAGKYSEGVQVFA